MGYATKPTVTIGEATKKDDYDNLVKFLCASEELDGDAGYTLAVTDCGKTVKVNSGSAQTVNLPSVDSSHIGIWFTVIKLGAGKVTINAPDSDVIVDSGAGGTIYNEAAGETYAMITLKLVSATVWSVVGAIGTWNTGNSIFAFGGKIAQIVTDSYTTVATKSTGFPNDDTKPQRSEGDEILSCAITPKSASSTILIMFTANLRSTTAFSIACLFINSANDALLTVYGAGTIGAVLKGQYSESSGSVSARTYSVRVGDSTGNNCHTNDQPTAKFGDSFGCHLTVMEVL